MNTIELEVLEACHECIIRNQELFPLLELTLGVKQDEVFYTWALRRCQQRGQLSNTTWVYFFHGIECDLKNTSDGRFLRIDFGPHGRIDTFTAWGVLQFIMTSVLPWSEFHNLKLFFAKADPPFDEFSGDFDKFCSVWNILEHEGCFEVADEQLIQLQKCYTMIDAHRVQHVRFPAGISEKMQIDCSVAHRKILSQHGCHLLETR